MSEKCEKSKLSFALTSLCVSIFSLVWYIILNDFSLSIRIFGVTLNITQVLLLYCVVYVLGLCVALLLGVKFELLVGVFPVSVLELIMWRNIYFIVIAIESVMLLYFLINKIKKIHNKLNEKRISNNEVRLNYKKVAARLFRSLKHELGVAIYIYFAIALVLSFIPNKRKAVNNENELIYSSNAEKLEYEEGTSLFDANKSELIKFKEDIYLNLSLDEKLELAQLVVNIECYDLGIDPVQVATKCLCDSNLNGYYSSKNDHIVIDTHILQGDFGVDVLIACCLHEVYHVYEIRCAEIIDISSLSAETANLRFFRDVASWKQEMYDYQDSSESVEKYAHQKLEIRANEYSNTWTREYIDYINSIELDEYQGD